MKKSVGTIGTLLLGGLLSSCASTKDMNTHKGIDLSADTRRDGISSPKLENEMFSTKNSVDSTLDRKNNNSKYNVSLTPVGKEKVGLKEDFQGADPIESDGRLAGKITINPLENTQIEIGTGVGTRTNTSRNTKEQISAYIGLKQLYDAANMGVAVSFEKGTELQKIMGTIVKGYNGGLIKLTVAHLDKLMTAYFDEVDRTYEEMMSQTSIGLETKYKVGKFVDQIGLSVTYHDSKDLDFGKIGSTLLETPTQIITTDYYGGIIGGQTVQAGASVDLKLRENLKLSIGAGMESFEFNDTYGAGESGTNPYLTTLLQYKPTLDDLISLNYGKTGTIERYGVDYTRRLTDTLDVKVGYERTNNSYGEDEDLVAARLVYRFGGPSSKEKSLFSKKTENGKLNYSDLTPAGSAGTDVIFLAKKQVEKIVTKVDKNQDAVTVLGAPTLESKTNTTLNLTSGVFLDSNGVQNVTVRLYSDAGCTVLVGTDTNGDFTGLTGNTTYYARTEGEAKNGTTGAWEPKVSQVLTIATDLDPVVIVDTGTTLTQPTLTSKTNTSINLTNGTFTDTDGVRNVTVKLYSDAGCTVLVGTSSTGDFTGLSGNTTYYARTEGEALNGATGVWEAKTTSALSVTTDLDPVPVATSMNFSGVTPSTKNTAYNNFTLQANTTIKAGSTLTTSSGAVTYTISGDTVTVTSWAGTNTNEVYFYLNQPGETVVSIRQVLVDANTAPTGTSFTLSAENLNTKTIDLTSYINDVDGNTMTVNYVGSGVSFGDIVIGSAGIIGNNATITVTEGSGEGYIDYTVSDGIDTSGVYRITIPHLLGE